ncbi:MAG: hypothetical protein LBO09_08855 [Candidatus Peribacteria bacterium]|jgi:hypothetical protein|nr:hypothetical protein [Candidatus Peribacteria bacterium]
MEKQIIKMTEVRELLSDKYELTLVTHTDYTDEDASRSGYRMHYLNKVIKILADNKCGAVPTYWLDVADRLLNCYIRFQYKDICVNFASFVRWDSNIKNLYQSNITLPKNVSIPRMHTLRNIYMDRVYGSDDNNSSYRCHNPLVVWKGESMDDFDWWSESMYETRETITRWENELFKEDKDYTRYGRCPFDNWEEVIKIANEWVRI